MRKCEKDFDRQVFSFLFCLLDALPLSKFNWAIQKVDLNQYVDNRGVMAEHTNCIVQLSLRDISSEVYGLATIVVVECQSETKFHLEIRGSVKATPYRFLGLQ